MAWNVSCQLSLRGILLLVTMVTWSPWVRGQQCQYVSRQQISAAQTLWRYMLLNHTVTKSDVIMALGSYDVRVARQAARLWLRGLGDWLLVSGNSGNLTRGLWCQSEAEVFARIALEMGVPGDKILMETESTNTGENILHGHRLLKMLDLLPDSVILVQKPYMERRALATFQRQWPGSLDSVRVLVSSPNVSLLDYPNEDVGELKEVIKVLVGDMQRILTYPGLGLQTEQYVPMEVLDAYEELCHNEYFTGHFML